MRNLISAAVLAPVILLVGCSDSNNFLGPDGAGQSTSGVAYDGYLANARFCVDVNLNRACDPSEPRTMTNSAGAFTLGGLTARQAATPLILDVNANTRDLDDNTAPPLGLQFAAPAGSRVVSAFTTIIQNKIEAAIAAALPGPIPTLADLKFAANLELATELGVQPLDLTNYDPILNKNDTTLTIAQRTTAAKLHMVNRILSEQIADLAPQARALASNNDSAAFAAVIAKLNAADVMTAVNTDLGGMALNDLIALTDTSAVTSETPPTLPSLLEIAAIASQDADVITAINNLLPPVPTGATGGGA